MVSQKPVVQNINYLSRIIVHILLLYRYATFKSLHRD